MQREFGFRQLRDFPCLAAATVPVDPRMTQSCEPQGASNPSSLLVTTPDGTITNFNGYASAAQFVPEPGSILLLGVGLLGLAPLTRRIRRARRSAGN